MMRTREYIYTMGPPPPIRGCLRPLSFLLLLPASQSSVVPRLVPGFRQNWGEIEGTRTYRGRRTQVTVLPLIVETPDPREKRWDNQQHRGEEACLHHRAGLRPGRGVQGQTRKLDLGGEVWGRCRGVRESWRSTAGFGNPNGGLRSRFP